MEETGVYKSIVVRVSEEVKEILEEKLPPHEVFLKYESPLKIYYEFSNPLTLRQASEIESLLLNLRVRDYSFKEIK
jgi:hypothetical protein